MFTSIDVVTQEKIVQAFHVADKVLRIVRHPVDIEKSHQVSILAVDTSEDFCWRRDI